MVPCRPRSEVQPLTARSGDDGLATRYIGVADPSEPNYVAMLGGSTFGISSDDPYFFPGQMANQANLPSPLQAVGQTWKGYYQGIALILQPDFVIFMLAWLLRVVRCEHRTSL